MDDVGVTGLILTAVGIVVALGGITVATLLVTSGKTDRKIDTLRKDMGKARKNNEAAHAAIGKNIKRRTSRRRIQRIVRGVTKELTAPPPAKPGPEPEPGPGPGPKPLGQSN